MFGSATIKVRPTKMALLVDPQSAVQVREAIRLATSLWGGHYFPIIPLYRKAPPNWAKVSVPPPSAKEKVLGYIDAFDPDILVQFSENLPPYLADSRLLTIKPKDVWERTTFAEQPAFGLGVFTLLNDVYKRCFQYKPRYPTKVCIPNIPDNFGLFWASVFGEYSDKIRSTIDCDYADHLDIEWPRASAESFFALIDRGILFPRRLTEWGLANYGVGGFANHANIYFMDAGKTEDVIDYWNLRASGRAVLPLPKQFLEQPSFKKAVEEFLKQERRTSQSNAQLVAVPSFIPSQHSTFDELRSYTKTLDLPTPSQSHPDSSQFSLQHWYPRIWHDWARSKDGGVADVYAQGEKTIDIRNTTELKMRLEPVLPEFVHDDWIYTDALCANEVDINIYGAEEYLAEVYPKIGGDHLASAISGLSLRGEWRIGRHGQVKLVKNRYSESRTIPTAEAILFAWLQDRGWQAELSTPGILAKQIFNRLDGYPLLLANKSVLGLIEHMNGGSVSPDGTPYKEKNFTAAREMAVGTVKSRLNGKSTRSKLYDTLVSKGVFRLGLQAQCPTCQRHTWFPLATLSESLECPKCLSSFAAAGHIDQAPGEWYYRTVGPFSVPKYADGAYAVLLTIDAIKRGPPRTLRTTTVPSFIAKSPGRDDLEADFAMFWRELSSDEPNDGLLFGECKTYGPFKQNDFDRMHYLGETFPGSVLAFGTLRGSLTSKEVTSIRKLARSGRKYWKSERSINPVLVLTGTELLHPQGPPYCWTEAQKKSIHRIHGLLGLCDATQQLYLDLPPLHQEWLKRNEQRRARRSHKQ